MIMNEKDENVQTERLNRQSIKTSTCIIVDGIFPYAGATAINESGETVTVQEDQEGAFFYIDKQGDKVYFVYA